MACPIVLLAVLLSEFALIADSTFSYHLNAAVVGYRDSHVGKEIDLDKFSANQSSSQVYCKVKFTNLEYDQTNGDTVYHSLNSTRTTLNDDNIAIVLGPFIDVFTSMSYVIRKQIHLITDASESMESSNRTLPILPDTESMSNAIAKITKELFRWDTVVFLSQSDFSPVVKLSKQGIEVYPIRLPSKIRSKDDAELIQTLTSLRNAQRKKFIFHSMNRSVVRTTLEAAEKLLLLHSSLSWFITYLDFDDVISIVNKSADIYGLQLLNSAHLPSSKKDRLSTGLFTDAVSLLFHFLSQCYDCSVEPTEDRHVTAKDMVDMIEDVDGSCKYNAYIGALGQYKWRSNKKKTKKMRTQYSFGVMSYVPNNQPSVKVGECDKCKIKDGKVLYEEIIKVHPYCSRNCSFVDGEINVAVLENRTEQDRSLDKVLSGNNFTVITKVDPPFVIKEGDAYTGFAIDVLKTLATMMNFHIHIFELDSITKNPKDASADWDVIIKQLIAGNASMAVGSLAVKSDSVNMISFSYTIISSTVSMLAKRPTTSTVFFQFLWPFETELWLVILAFVFIAACALWIMSKYDSTQNASEFQFDIKESVWYSINVLLQGGTEYSPQTTCMRTIVAFFWFCTLIIISAYTANLAAFLTVQQRESKISSLDSLSKQSDVKYGMIRDSDLMNFFKYSEEDPYERMWTSMNVDEARLLVPNREAGIDLVRNGLNGHQFVFLDLSIVNDYYAVQQCDMESFDQKFKETKFSLGFPRGAPYKDDINRGILTLKEKGTLDEIQDRWWSVKKSYKGCNGYVRPNERKPATAELDVQNMLGVFIVLFSCAVLAIFVEISKRTCGEAIKKKLTDKKNKKANGLHEAN